MAADLQEIQDNQRISEIQIDKLEFILFIAESTLDKSRLR